MWLSKIKETFSKQTNLPGIGFLEHFQNKQTCQVAVKIQVQIARGIQTSGYIVPCLVTFKLQNNCIVNEQFTKKQGT